MDSDHDIGGASAATGASRDDLINKLKAQYAIVPKWALAVWGGAILLALSAVGITSLVGFNNAVVAISTEAATEAATKTAKKVAEEQARIAAMDQARTMVSDVYAGAIETARRTAEDTARPAERE